MEIRNGLSALKEIVSAATFTGLMPKRAGWISTLSNGLDDVTVTVTSPSKSKEPK